MQLHMVPLSVCQAENWAGLDMGLQSVLPVESSQCHLGVSLKDQCAESIFHSQICLVLWVTLQTLSIILLHRLLGGLWTHYPCVLKGSDQETFSPYSVGAIGSLYHGSSHNVRA